MRTEYDYDFLIIGSGFGGSTAALRLSEKGYRVAVLEKGRRISEEDMRQAEHGPRFLFWAPGLGLKGFFTQSIFRHVGIVGGVGVGGGSLVYAAVLLEPERTFFKDPVWSDMGLDWQAELAPHYATAARMLGRTQSQVFGPMDAYLQATAEALGAGESFGAPPLGIYFGEPEVIRPDPYFGGRGPDRSGCRRCGSCLTGCLYNAKNSLDRNYLYLAEQLGAKVLPLHQVTGIRPLQGGGYEVQISHPFKRRSPYRPLTAARVVISGGVLGTLALLFRCRDELKTLPKLSAQLGQLVRTNSEAIVGVLPEDEDQDLSFGTTISTHFYLDGDTHITQNRFPKGYTYMKWYLGPLVDEDRPFRRALKTLAAFARHPLQATVSWRARNWHKRICALTVMQQADNQISFRYGRSLFSFLRKGLQSRPVRGRAAPAYLPQANRAALAFAERSGGRPLNVLFESIANMSVTAHILGGAQIGMSAENGVIDQDHQVYGYPGLYVVDGSAIPANVGVNPSLTITAMAERWASRIPPKNDPGGIP